AVDIEIVGTVRDESARVGEGAVPIDRGQAMLGREVADPLARAPEERGPPHCEDGIRARALELAERLVETIARPRLHGYPRHVQGPRRRLRGGGQWDGGPEIRHA